jgi:hypothetical protein
LPKTPAENFETVYKTDSRSAHLGEYSPGRFLGNPGMSSGYLSPLKALR